MQLDSHSWLSRLPHDKLSTVVPPVRVETFHDDDVPAAKWRGYDNCDTLCYYRHSFSLWEEIFDDEEPYQRLQLSEHFEAWRTRDGLWLRRVQRVDGPAKCPRESADSGFELVEASGVPRL